MTRPKPKVTVLMPVYNAARYLEQALQSILNQTLSDFTLLVIDDGCSDDTVEIVEKANDKRIKLVHNEQNLGLITTLNKGLDLVETEFVARMDADDISMPSRLETQLQFMESYPEVGACGTWYDNILADGTEKPGGRYLQNHESILLKNLYQLHIIHGTSMMRMKVIQEHQLRFDPSFAHAEDYDFFVRLAAKSRLHNIQESLYKIRHHGESVSKKYSAVQHENSNRVKRRLFEALGVSASDNSMDYFREFMHQNYLALKGDAKKEVLELVSQLIEGNKEARYLPQEFLRKKLSIQVLHMLNQLSGNDEGLKHLFYNFRFKRFTDDPKLYMTTYGKVLLSR